MFLTQLTIEGLRARDDELADHALVSLASYGKPSSPLYAAIWLPSLRRDERKRVILPTPMTSSPVEPELEDYATSTATYMPILATGTGDRRKDQELGVTTTWVYEELVVKSPTGTPVHWTSPNVARVTTTLSDLLEYRADSLQKRQIATTCLSFDCVWSTNPRNGKPQKHYLGIFSDGAKPRANFGLFALGARIKDNVQGVTFSSNVKNARQGFKRCHLAVPGPKTVDGKREMAFHMREDTYEAWPSNPDFNDFLGGTITDGPMKLSELKPNLDTRSDAGLIPIQVGANGIGKDARFCVTWAPSQRPKTRYFRVHEGVEPGPEHVGYVPRPVRGNAFNTPPPSPLEPLRDIVRTSMETQAIRNAQIAIAVDGRLKLVWNLTYGENGWYATQPTHKFRFGSCAKLLLGARSVAMGETFLTRSLADALDLDDPNYDDIRIEDCLRHVSGLSVNTLNMLFNAWSLGGKSVPLRAGDFTRALRNGATESSQAYEPRYVEAYNNCAFVAAGEALGIVVNGSLNGYIDAMHQWWPFSILAENVIVLPKTKSLSINANEVPLCDWGCESNSIQIPDTDGSWQEIRDTGEFPPRGPSAYALYRDWEVMGPAGGLSMSSPVMVRLLQMLHPAESKTSKLGGNRLTYAQLDRMISKEPGLVFPTMANSPLADQPIAATPQPAMFSLGCVASKAQLVMGPLAGPVERQFAWGGTLVGGSKSGVLHYIRGSGHSAQSLSVAHVTNGPARLDQQAIYEEVKNLFINGLWNDTVDLFPPLSLA